MKKRLIFDLDSTREVTVFYIETSKSIQVQKVFLYDRGNESKFDCNIVAKTIDEIKQQVTNAMTK